MSCEQDTVHVKLAHSPGVAERLTGPFSIVAAIVENVHYKIGVILSKMF